MANEGDDSRRSGDRNTGIMDLNLYLGLPRSPRPHSLDLGSDLALGSSPFSSSSSSSTEVSRVPPAADAAMSGPSEPSDPYSPARALFVASPNPSPTTVTDPSLPSAAPGIYNPASEYPPFSPSYETFTLPYTTPHTPTVPPTPMVRGGPDAPYSPTYVQTFTMVQESDEPLAEGDGVPIHMPYDPLTRPGLFAVPLVGGSGSGGNSTHVPYSPPYVPVSVIPQAQDEVAFTPYQPIYAPMVDVTAHEDGPSSQRNLLQHAEFRLRSLIESSHRWRGSRRFRSSHRYRDESPNFATSSMAAPDQLFREVVTSDRPAETSGKRKVGDQGIVSESLKEEKEEKSGSAVNFECNVCLDIAKEPVVTSCGHLFCWPCLYQWLHLHCDHKECPVCKGEVTESNIIPIYGRGSSETEVEKNGTEVGDPGLKIPPRPRGHRFESWRQHIQRPISRRLGEGIANSWRRVLNEELQSGSRLDGQRDPSLMQGIIDGAHRRVLTRLRAHRLTRERDNLDPVSSLGQPPRSASPNSQNGGSINSILRDGIDRWHQFSHSSSVDRLASITADLTRIMSRFASGGSLSGAPASAVNPRNPEDPIAPPARQSVEQASASSTMAVIQGDAGVVDALAEPNNAGSSRPLRRRGRSSTSGSLDVDGGVRHARKRRRLN